MNLPLQRFVILIAVFIVLSSPKTNAQCMELFGMTTLGGEFNNGVIYKTDEFGNINIEHSFEITPNGCGPYSELFEASNGKMYGTTSKGGNNNSGILFEWNPITNSYNKILDFNGVENGSNPMGTLIQASNGKLYGMTWMGELITWEHYSS